MLKQVSKINKVIKFPSLNWVSFGYIQKKKVLILTNSKQKKYYVLPSFIHCSTKDSGLVLDCSVENKHDLIQFNSFVTLISDFKKSTNTSTKKKLRLKGLGFKTNFSSDSNFLELKLGYSHVIRVPIPKDEIKITPQKNLLIVESFDKTTVGNFVSKLRALKTPDSYKGKGFWYPYEKENFKVIKKK